MSRNPYVHVVYSAVVLGVCLLLVLFAVVIWFKRAQTDAQQSSAPDVAYNATNDELQSARDTASSNEYAAVHITYLLNIFLFFVPVVFFFVF